MSAVLQQAAGRLQHGDAQGALALCEQFLAQVPNHGDGLMLKAMTLGRLGQIEAAREAFDAAARHHAQPAVVLTNCANMLRRGGLLEDAAHRYRAATRSNPRHGDAWYGLALTLSDLEQSADAGHALDQVLALNPRHSGALNAKGALARDAGRDEEAEQCFSDAIAAHPQGAPARINRSALRRQHGDLDGALSDVLTALQLAPAAPDAHYQHASVLRMLGDLTAAEQAYLRAIELAPLRTDIHTDLAGLLWETGQEQRFLSVLASTLAQHPVADLAALLSKLAYRAGQPERALAAADQAIQLAPDQAEGWRLRGEAKAALLGPAAGLDDLKTATERDPNCVDAMHQYAETLLSAHRFADAAMVLDRDVSDADIQRHTALKTVAWRGLDDERYQSFCNYDRFTSKRMISTPPGYANLEAFNADLAGAIADLHNTKAQPLDQTLFGGTQSPGRLWEARTPVIQALASALLQEAHRFVADLPDDPTHPFLRRKTGTVKLAGAWSVRLQSGGGHVDHYHSAGWISACYYVQVPDSVMQGEKAGWLRLGASGVRDVDMPAERYVMPEPGSVIFFPSYMWHGVEPFFSDSVRVTAPFDLLPV